MQTEKLTALLIDDEERNTSNLSLLISKYCPDLEVVGEVHSGIEAERLIRDLQPEVLFLDIRMPGMDGFQLLSRLKDLEFQVVFVSAFEEYALAAIKENAVDYLLKPVSIVELKAVAEKLKQKRQSGGLSSDALDSLFRRIKQEPQKITFSTHKGLVVEDLENLVRVESDNNYTTAHLKSGEKIMLSKSIREFERTLANDRFFRIHNSHLINLEYIRSFSKQEGGFVLLKDGTHLPVSRRNLAELESLLRNRYKSI